MLVNERLLSVVERGSLYLRALIQHLIFRISGTKEYVAVPIKNTLRLSEITMSAYIYPEKEYDILNLSGDVMRKTIGKDLMKHFDDRTQTHKKKKSFK